MPKNHPFKVNKFLVKKKLEYRKSHGIRIKKQNATPISLKMLIQCKKL